MTYEEMLKSLDRIEQLMAQALAQGQPLSRADALFLKMRQERRDKEKANNRPKK